MSVLPPLDVRRDAPWCESAAPGGALALSAPKAKRGRGAAPAGARQRACATTAANARAWPDRSGGRHSSDRAHRPTTDGSPVRSIAVPSSGPSRQQAALCCSASARGRSGGGAQRAGVGVTRASTSPGARHPSASVSEATSSEGDGSCREIAEVANSTADSVATPLPSPHPTPRSSAEATQSVTAQIGCLVGLTCWFQVRPARRRANTQADTSWSVIVSTPIRPRRRMAVFSSPVASRPLSRLDERERPGLPLRGGGGGEPRHWVVLGSVVGAGVLRTVAGGGERKFPEGADGRRGPAPAGSDGRYRYPALLRPGQIDQDHQPPFLDDVVAEIAAPVGEDDRGVLGAADDGERGGADAGVGAQQGHDAGDVATQLRRSVAELLADPTSEDDLVGQARRQPVPRRWSPTGRRGRPGRAARGSRPPARATWAAGPSRGSNHSCGQHSRAGGVGAGRAHRPRPRGVRRRFADPILTIRAVVLL